LGGGKRFGDRDHQFDYGVIWISWYQAGMFVLGVLPYLPRKANNAALSSANSGALDSTTANH
jgi:hypothetical protein